MSVLHVGTREDRTGRCSCGEFIAEDVTQDRWWSLMWDHKEAFGVCPECGGTCRFTNDETGAIRGSDDFESACGTCDGKVCACPVPFPGTWSEAVRNGTQAQFDANRAPSTPPGDEG